MGRRSGGGGRSPSPSRGLGGAPRRPVSNVPARAPPAAPVAAAPPPAAVGQPRQPGMFAQMATTAAGVAVGSAVGHTIGAAMMGGGGHSEAAAAPEQQVQQQQQYYQQTQNESNGLGPCQFQMKQFLECAQNQHDITLCQGFNEALRECRVNHGLPLQ